jgi:hypothetical protein
MTFQEGVHDLRKIAEKLSLNGYQEQPAKKRRARGAFLLRIFKRGEWRGEVMF